MVRVSRESAIYLPPRSLSPRFISSQAAPRRRFFQHLDHQVEHKLESAWTICSAGKVLYDRSSFCRSIRIGLSGQTWSQPSSPRIRYLEWRFVFSSSSYQKNCPEYRPYQSNESNALFLSSGGIWRRGAWCSASASAPASGERAAALASDVALFCFRAERQCAAQTWRVWTLDNSNLEGKVKKDSRSREFKLSRVNIWR